MEARGSSPLEFTVRIYNSHQGDNISKQPNPASKVVREGGNYANVGDFEGLVVFLAHLGM